MGEMKYDYEQSIRRQALKHCSRHPRCVGPSLIIDHASKCPDSNMEDCDNDQCWVPCQFCVTDDETIIAQEARPTTHKGESR